MASWKIVQEPAEENKVEYVTFADAGKFFAVDASGSTAGSVMVSEQKFVEAIHQASPAAQAGTAVNSVAKWGSRCQDPVTDFNTFRWSSDLGGTSPTQVLRNEKALSAILGADVWFL